APTFNIVGGGGFGSLNGNVNLVTSSSGGFTKLGSGTLTMSPTIGGSGNTYTGATTATGGLQLNFSATVLTNVISSNSPIVFNTGLNLILQGIAGSANAQTFASTTFNAGANSITLTTSGTA